MPADEIKANYDQLAQVASRFQNQSQATQEMIQSVRSSMDELKGGWEGRGSNAFFSEMQGEVLPAVNRLRQALQEASRTTNQIVQAVKQAEDEASAPFKAT